MKQFNQYLKEYHYCQVDMFNLKIEFYDYHNDISGDDAITIDFNEGDIPLSKWNNDDFLRFINDIEANKECEFRYRNKNLDYFIYRNGILTYSIDDAGVLEWEHELIFEPEYIPCLNKMHQDIDKYIQFINNRTPEEKQLKIDHDIRSEEYSRLYRENKGKHVKQYRNEKEYLQIKYNFLI